MFPSSAGTIVDLPLHAPARGRRRKGRRFRAGSLAGVEFLELRTLLTTFTVDVVNFTFTPNNVTIKQGDTVEWVWQTS